MKKHSSPEIIEKLAKADQLAAQGIPQNTICRQLGISVMTLHRWRARASDSVDAGLEQRLLLENSRLRDAAANLLLEIRALEETRMLDRQALEATRADEPASPQQQRLKLPEKDLEADRPRERALAPDA